MKTQPDEATLTLWMDGELEGDELKKIEAWAQAHPEILAERDAVQAMSADIKANVPNSIEPPYADFFNQRILRHIHDEEPVSAEVRKPSIWQGIGRWFALPLAAGAMAVCFYMGTQVGDMPESAPPSYATATVPTVYTPDGEVSAAMFKSQDSSATVIVLEGLDDIPDDMEIVGTPDRNRNESSGAVMVNHQIVY